MAYIVLYARSYARCVTFTPASPQESLDSNVPTHDQWRRVKEMQRAIFRAAMRLRALQNAGGDVHPIITQSLIGMAHAAWFVYGQDEMGMAGMNDARENGEKDLDYAVRLLIDAQAACEELIDQQITDPDLADCSFMDADSAHKKITVQAHGIMALIACHYPALAHHDSPPLDDDVWADALKILRPR